MDLLFVGPIGKITETGLWPIGPTNKKIQPVVEKKNSTWGCKLQAASFKLQATLDNGSGIL